jgi:hypothetical protein
MDKGRNHARLYSGAQEMTSYDERSGNSTQTIQGMNTRCRHSYLPNDGSIHGSADQPVECRLAEHWRQDDADHVFKSLAGLRQILPTIPAASRSINPDARTGEKVLGLREVSERLLQQKSELITRNRS